MNIATLEIEFLAEISRLRQDMNEVRNMTTQTQNVVAGASDAMASALKGIAVGLSVGAFVSWMRSASDAADSMKAFSQKTGVAVEDVAGLSLAFQQGGVDSDKLLSAIAKMSKQIAEGGEGFRNLGVETRNADGSLRNAKDVIYDVADATAAMGDGAKKTAMLQEIFGKSASDLIPTLNEGSEGLRGMADMAEKLGLAMSGKTADEADKFNDTMELIGESSKGISRQVMAELLPTLNSLAGAMLDGATSGDVLKNTAMAIAVVLKALYTVFSVVSEYLTQFGKNLGAVAAMIGAALKGDFAGAMTIAKERAKDMTDDVSARAKSLGNVWTNTGGETVAALAAVNAKSKESTVQTKEQKEAVDAAAKVYSSYTEKLTATRNELQGQISSGEKLTGTQKVLNELTSNNTAEVKKLTEAARQHLIVEAKKNVELEKSAIALEESRKAAEKLRGEIDKKNETLDSEIQKQLESNAKLRDGEAASIALEVAKLREAAATAEKNAITAQEANQDASIIEGYKQQADKLRELADLKSDGVHLKIAQDSAAEWKKTTDSIQNGLTDSLMRGFENGKNLGDSFLDGLKAQFKALVLQPTIQAIMSPVAGAMGGLFGGGATGSAAGGGGIMGGIMNAVSMGKAAYSFLNGGMLTSLSNGIVSLGAKLGSTLMQDFGGSMVGGASPFATSGTAGMLGQYAGKAIPIVGGYMLGSGLNSAISGEYSVSKGMGTAQNVVTAVASIFGGPIGGAIGGVIGGVVNRAFGMGPKKIRESGIEGTIGSGGVDAQTYADWKKKGGWLRKSKYGTDYGDLDDATAQALDDGASAIYSQTAVWAEALGLPSEKLAGVTASFKVQLGEDAEANQAAISKVFEDYQGSMVAKFGNALALYSRAGESLVDTMGRLAVLQTFSESINEFGGVFSRIAGLSIDAREQLIGFAGGIDALIGKTQTFVDAYYSDSEKAGLQSKQIAAALTDLGLDPTAFKTLGDYRAVVESQGLATEDSRAMLAALLDIAPAFANVAAYLTANDVSLGEAAAQAPQTALLESLFTQSQIDSAEMVDQQMLANDNLSAIEYAVRTGNQSIVDALAASGGVVTEAISRAISSSVASASRAVVAA